ncbi:MBL fold metallo-hydrolase [bacterium]|nr:MBL fold metallo-hydrolase [bacterium]
MKITFLGTGNSTGVPVLACDCRVCKSENPKNKRLRASILITTDNGKNIVIDTSTDFRQQCLQNKITNVDAIFYTHAHADHILGLDEIRAFNFASKKAIPIFGSKETLEGITKTFHYIAEPIQKGGGIPQILLNFVESDFELFGLNFQLIPLKHGLMDVFGLRTGDFAYVTDFNKISENSKAKLKNLKLLVLGILREKAHATHIGLQEGLALVEELKPEKTLVTHTAHAFDYDEFNNSTPKNFEMAFDGLQIEL